MGLQSQSEDGERALHNELCGQAGGLVERQGRERVGEGEIEREREIQRDIERHREKERQRDKERETERGIERHRE